jgi:hypothetical protein
MREQLRYWRKECEDAERVGEHERVAECERFIKQCEEVVTAFERAQNRTST